MNPHHCMNASIPFGHRYGLVDRAILTGLSQEENTSFEQCVIYGVTSIPSRAWHFSIMTESGASWARIPIHMLRHEEPEEGAPNHPITDLQCWDCHGWDFAVTRYEYLRDMACEFRTAEGQTIPAAYWFTADHTDNGWSNYPPEHKCYHFLLLEDGSGQIAAMPNNRIRWRDDSFCDWSLPLDYRVMSRNTWHAETSRVNPDHTAITKDEQR